MNLKKNRGKNLEPTQRQLRVGEQIRHALAEIFLRGECHIDGLDTANITVSEVRASPDLKHAVAYVTALIGDTDSMLDMLNENSSILRKYTSNKLKHMKFSPRLRFVKDNSFDEAQKINDLMMNPDVARDLSK